MRVRYSPKALSELDNILSYIAERSPQDARRVQRRLHRISTLLAVYPNAGEPTNMPGLRRIVAVPYPYLVFYKVVDDEVIITGLRHGARD